MKRENTKEREREDKKIPTAFAFVKTLVAAFSSDEKKDAFV